MFQIAFALTALGSLLIFSWHRYYYNEASIELGSSSSWTNNNNNNTACDTNFASRYSYEDTYENRLETYWRTCFKVPAEYKNNRVGKGFFYIVLNRHRLAFCPQMKVGSNTWRRRFQMMLSHSGGKIAFSRVYEPKHFYFTFVRHPFQRIVSTFQDKIVDHSYKDWRRRITNDSGDVPTFGQFVTLLLSGGIDSDPHVTPFHRKCNLCFAKIDFIGRLETSSRDTVYVMGKTPKGKDPLGSDAVKHKTSGGDTASLTLKYFAQLTMEQKSALVEKYRLDFEAFGYEFECFLRHIG